MELASKRSAGAAFREFFSLSPLWLRYATAFAAFAIFALFLFSIWRVSNPNRVIVREIAKSTPSPVEEIQSTIDTQNVPLQSVDRIAKPDGRDDKSITSVSSQKPETHSAVIRRHSSPGVQRPRQQYNANEYAILNAARKRQILSDLGLVSSSEEEMAPQLSDLIVEPESNN